MSARTILSFPRGRALLLVTALAATCPAGQAVYAHEEATGVVKERMDTMKQLGKRMKTLKSLVRSSSAYDATRVASLAGEIRGISDQVESGFPAGSIEHPSEALPAIWENWERFVELIDAMKTESEKLGEAARDSDQRAALKQFAALGKTCRGCHTDFRQKKD
ncbi:MAG: cytochrome c [Gammaproteobacteria bacterium]|nr:cytochrome c [Gammaproteobacteria bacterium]